MELGFDGDNFGPTMKETYSEGCEVMCIIVNTVDIHSESAGKTNKRNKKPKQLPTPPLPKKSKKQTKPQKQRTKTNNPTTKNPKAKQQ